MRHPAFLFSFVLLALCSQPIPHAGAADTYAELSLSQPELIKEAEEGFQHLLNGISPEKKAVPKYVLKDGRYVLYGNLFRTGENYALCELESSMLGLALWQDGEWTMRGLWAIPLTWRPEGWKSSSEDYLPATPATKPFELAHLSADKTPEVIAGGEVDKYFQAWYMLRFLPDKKTLRIVDSSRAKPEWINDLVRLYTDSGRRSIFAEWNYFRWHDANLVPVASWHEETPYNAPEEPFIAVEVVGKNAECTAYRIIYGENSAKNADSFVIRKDGQPFATVEFHWKETPLKHPELNSETITNAWLFNKLTGLPLSAFPFDSSETELRPFENYGKVRVTGTKEALKLLK